MAIWSAEIKELETLYTSIKGRFPELEKELEQLIKTEDANVALLYSRRSLEVIVTDFCERELKRDRGTEPLKGIIDKLNRGKMVPHNIIASMQNINSLSTFGTHPKDFKPRQVKPVLLDLTTVLEWYLEYMQDQESVVGESEVQGKRKVTTGIIRRRSKSGKSIIMGIGVLLVAATIIISLIVFDVIGVGKQVRAGSIESIIILPLGNYTGDDALDIYIKGIHSSLINEIGEKTGLRVIGAITSNLYKNTNKSIQEITKELNVDAAMEVDVSCLGDTVCWHTRLMGGGPQEKQLWMGDYRDAKGNLFNMFNQVIRQIAGEVKISLKPEQEAKLVDSRTIDPEAIDAIVYANGLNTQLNFNQDILIKAINVLKNAIEKESDWAPLYGTMGKVWYWLSFFGYESLDSTLPKVYENINKALALDSDLTDANALIADIALTYEWNWEKAEAGYKKVLEHNPNEAEWRIRYSFLLYILQRPEEAKKQMDLAYKLDALNPFIQFGYVISLCSERDYISAMSFLEELLATDPDNVLLNGWMESAAFVCGDLSRMFEATKHAIKMFPFGKETFIDIEKTYNEGGFNAAIEEIIRQLENLVDKGYRWNMSLAFYYYVINQDDKAIEYFEKAAKAREEFVTGIGTGMMDYSRLYDNPRFSAILKEMNLPLPKSD